MNWEEEAELHAKIDAMFGKNNEDEKLSQEELIIADEHCRELVHRTSNPFRKFLFRLMNWRFIVSLRKGNDPERAVILAVTQSAYWLGIVLGFVIGILWGWVVLP